MDKSKRLEILFPVDFPKEDKMECLSMVCIYNFDKECKNSFVISGKFRCTEHKPKDWNSIYSENENEG